MLSDDEVWAKLRDASANNRVPDDVRDAARTSWAWRDPDSALAALVGDSADPAELELLAGVRATGSPRLLTFAAAEVTIELEVSGHGTAITLVGQVVPAGPATISADHRLGVATAPADELGRFTVSEVSEGPVRLRCVRAGGGTPVRTDWVLL